MSRSDQARPRVGDAIPELSVEIDTVHVFMFSAATWNRHLIHYDLGQAMREGHDSVVAQRSLLGNYFVRQVQAWLGDDGDLSALDWKVVRGSVPGDTLTCRGEVAAAEGDSVSLRLEMANQHGDTVATGGATALLGATGPAPGGNPTP